MDKERIAPGIKHVKSKMTKEQITEEENERRFKACLEWIHNLTHEKLVKLMGKEWLEDYRRQFP